MLRINEADLERYQRELQNEVRNEINNARNILGNISQHNSWSASGMVPVRQNIVDIRRRLQNHANTATSISNGVRNVRDTVRSRVRTRRDAFNNFPTSNRNSGVLRRVGKLLLSIAEKIVFKPIPPIMTEIIERLNPNHGPLA